MKDFPREQVQDTEYEDEWKSFSVDASTIDASDSLSGQE